jgi:hypothetical protein
VQPNSVRVSLNITMPEKVSAALDHRNSFWATLQRWVLPTEAWAVLRVSDISTLVAQVSGPDIPSPIRVTKRLINPAPGETISIDLDVPLGLERVFSVDCFNAANARICHGQSLVDLPLPDLPARCPCGATVIFGIIDTTISIITTSLPGGTVDRAYSATLQAENANGAVTWAVVGEGPLPPGLILNQSTGIIAGTSTTAGTFTFTVRATDSSALFDDQELSISIAAQLTVTTTRLPSGTLGAFYSVQLQSAGGIGAVSWRIVTGSLPSGLSISQAGVISGGPTTSGTFAFTIEASDTAGRTDNQDLSITIAPSLTITTGELPLGIAGEPYNAVLTASGGVAPYTWSTSPGQLPPGLSLRSTGIISGTPGCTEGSELQFEFFTVTYFVRDTNGAFDEKELTLRIQCFPIDS